MQRSPAAKPAPNRGRVWAGTALLVVGLLGHVLAAHATGGTAVDYLHHIAGFFLLSLVSALILVGAGRWFWRGRHDVTLLIVGALQALLGLMIYLESVRMAGAR